MTKTKNNIEQKLNILFPDKIVNNLKGMDEDLYKEIFEVAKKNKSSIKEYLENNGFIYLRKPIIQMYIEDYMDLKNIYEDNVVESLYEKNNKLYYKLLNHSKLKNLSLKQYLNSLGFEYELRKENLQLDTIKKELQNLYNNGKNIYKLSARSPQLYYKIYQYAQKENTTMKDVVAEMGFNLVVDKNTSTNSNPVNKNTSKDKNRNLVNNTLKKRGRPKKVTNDIENEKELIKEKEEKSKDNNIQKIENYNSNTNNPSKKRGRPKKSNIEQNNNSVVVPIENLKEEKSVNNNLEVVQVEKKRRGRPKKNSSEQNNNSVIVPIEHLKVANALGNGLDIVPTEKKKRGRPKKNI